MPVVTGYFSGQKVTISANNLKEACKQFFQRGDYPQSLKEPCMHALGLPIPEVGYMQWKQFTNHVKDVPSITATTKNMISMLQPTCLANSTEAIENLVCEAEGFTPYVVPEAYSNTTLALGTLAAVAVGSAAVYSAYRLYNCMNQPVVEVKPEPEIVKPVVKPVPPVKPNIIPSKAYEHGLKNLRDVEADLTKQALGKVEKDKLEKIFESARQTLKQGLKSTYGLSHNAIVEEILTLIKELNAISFEGKGVLEEDKPEVSYYKRAVIAMTEALQYVFSFIGQFFASEYNPVAKTLIGRSFFLSAPMTPREERAVQSAKDSAICVLESIEADRALSYTI